MTDSHDLGGRVDAGKDVNTLIAETGFSRKILDEYAKLAGFTFVRTKAGTYQDPPRTQRRPHGPRLATRASRNTAPCQRRHRRPSSACVAKRSAATGDYGIPGRASGSDGHVVTNLHHPNLPRDIRRAVEGQRNGWQRLRRFQQIMAHPSMNTTAAALRPHTQNLNLQIQRLEADIGGQLLQRAPHRYAPMAPTCRGQRLLDHLEQPTLRELLSRYADANARPKIGPYNRRRTHQPARHDPWAADAYVDGPHLTRRLYTGYSPLAVVAC